MKLTATIRTSKGLYPGIETKGSTLGECLKKVVPKFDELPDEVDGEKLINWTSITLEITRNE